MNPPNRVSQRREPILRAPSSTALHGGNTKHTHTQTDIHISIGTYQLRLSSICYFSYCFLSSPYTNQKERNLLNKVYFSITSQLHKDWVVPERKISFPVCGTEGVLVIYVNHLLLEVRSIRNTTAEDRYGGDRAH